MNIGDHERCIFIVPKPFTKYMIHALSMTTLDLHCRVGEVTKPYAFMCLPCVQVQIVTTKVSTRYARLAPNAHSMYDFSCINHHCQRFHIKIGSYMSTNTTSTYQIIT